MTKKMMIIAGSTAAALLIGVLAWWLCSGDSKQAHIGDKIYLLKDNAVPMRLKVVTRSDGSAQVAVKFFDLDGKAVGRFEQSYTGGSIHVSLLDVNIDGHHVYLPGAMTQYAKPDTLHMSLPQHYVKDGFPMIYNSQIADPKLHDEIGLLYELVSSGEREKIETNSNRTVQLIEITLNEPMERVNYAVTTKTTGGAYFTN